MQTDRDVYEFDPDTILVSKTDPRGVITYANRHFCDAANLTQAQLLGQPHSRVRHPEMPRSVFSLMWEHLNEGREFFGIVQNRREGGGSYWVLAHVVPDVDPSSGEIIGFHSSRRYVSPVARGIAAGLYAELRAAEASAPSRPRAAQAGRDALARILKSAGLTYEQWIMSVIARDGA